MSQNFEGQCQCGDLRYRVLGDSATMFVCHCTECQRQSASAFGMALWVKDAELELLHGTLKEWTRLTPSGKNMVCSFCSQCGCRIFHQMHGKTKLISIKPGTLNNVKFLIPVAHIWTKSKQDWVKIPDGVLEYPENPPAFDAIFQAWLTLQSQKS